MIAVSGTAEHVAATPLGVNRCVRRDAGISALDAVGTVMPSVPDNPFPCEERVEVQSGKSPYLQFDANDYSIPHHYVGRTLAVSATLKTVRILDAGTVLAAHRRSFDRGQQVENPAHIEGLERHKRLGREHHATDRLHHAAPSSKALFVAAAERNHHLGVLARGLIDLLNAYDPVALERAIAAALQSDAAYFGGVRHFIDQHRKESDNPPARARPARRPAAAHTLGAPHDLADYDRLHDESDSGDADAHQHHDHEQDTTD